MKSEFLDYLKSIGLTEPLVIRIESIFQFYKEFCPEEIEDIFVSDSFNDGGNREYENLLFFSKKYVMEAKQFITKDNFDFTLMEYPLRYWTIEKQDYDFKASKDTSRLQILVHLNWQSKFIGEFKSSKNNCDHLSSIFRKYFVSQQL
jgi:hypothetical protein